MNWTPRRIWESCFHSDREVFAQNTDFLLGNWHEDMLEEEKRINLKRTKQTLSRSMSIFWLCSILIAWSILGGNISGGNQPLRANYGNFNLSHMMLIQRRSHGRWKGWFAKPPLQSRLPPPMNFVNHPFHLPWTLPWIKIVWLRLKFS
jgi:hypothetical protein